MREKLIELLGKVTCTGNGESLGSCPDRKYGLCGEVANLSYCVIQNIANYLIANGVTVLPCKIGDTVWAVRYYGKTPVIKKCVVSEMMYLEDMRLGIAVKSNNKYSVRGFWGKDIFATREECVAALPEPSKGE